VQADFEQKNIGVISFWNWVEICGFGGFWRKDKYINFYELGMILDECSGDVPEILVVKEGNMDEMVFAF
jgi:hypothetical protein